MTAPTKADIIAAGWKMSANISDALVSRCAAEVKTAYLLRRVEESAISAATAADGIGMAWIVLTFLRCAQDDVFATRTGGENKSFNYGQHTNNLEQVKASAAIALKAVDESATKCERYDDICRVFFRTQFFN